MPLTSIIVELQGGYIIIHNYNIAKFVCCRIYWIPKTVFILLLCSGKYGNLLDEKGAKSLFGIGDDDEDDEYGPAAKELLRKREEEESLPCHSMTSPRQMMMVERHYGYLPYNEEKPCLYVVGLFEDFRKRLLHSNLLSRIAETLVSGKKITKTWNLIIMLISGVSSGKHVLTECCLNECVNVGTLGSGIHCV